MDGDWIERLSELFPQETETEQIVGLVRKQPTRQKYPVDPSIKLVQVTVAPPDLSELSGDLERLLLAVSERCDLEPHVGLTVLRTLQSTLRTSDWKITCVIRLGDCHHRTEIIDIWPGHVERGAFGIAVDIGTTTIAAHLCDLTTGDVLASGGIVNPQVPFGADLLARVAHSMMNPGSHTEMTAVLRAGLYHLIGRLRLDVDAPLSLMYDAVIVCNPIIHHLFLGLDPIELGRAPFTYATSNAISFEARDVDLPIHPRAKVYLLPAVGKHVGADAAAVLLYEAPENADELTLIVDIGTNAEIFLGNKSRVVSTSCPTGPALEGAEVTHGRRAEVGAIETVRIDPDTKKIRFKVIGSDLWSDDPDFETSIAGFGVTGICGSGVIEMIAEMRMAGIVDQSGRIGTAEQTGCPHCFADVRGMSVSMYKGEKHIVFTNNDVREVQLAKAALFASIQLLMDDLKTKTVDRIILAGAFGSHISAKHAMVLGLLPDCDLERVSSTGNAAGAGACMALLDVGARRRIEATVQRIVNVETATDPKFQDHFLKAVDIPNALELFPMLSAEVVFPDVDYRTHKRRSQTKR